MSAVIGEVSGRVIELLKIAEQLKALSPVLSGKKRQLLAERLEAELNDIQISIRKAELSALEFEKAQIQLNDEIKRLKQWHEEKAGYEEYITPAGGATYRRKHHGSERGSGHHLCATCFENDKKSVLQPIPGEGVVQFKCHQCGTPVMMETLRGFVEFQVPEWER
ncbi:hypothetical protein [Vreelandella alkaliphila]|uniref:hypothetical protein n=1 Tax=Vreelandella alkaliphila TaxID=272774 RepID=UPI003FD6CAEB